ncbi:MAG: RidA family protein [Oscillospiraceae bacterium]|nr:RidA family protein [Oscillospiraceae bacterium]
MKQISTSAAPAAVGPYSQAIGAGDLIFTSGQLPIDPATGAIEKADVAGQTEQAIRNIAAILQADGCTLDDVVKTTCYLKNIADFAAFNEVYGKYFTAKPARSCIEAAALPKGALLELDAIAVRKG